MQVNHLALKEEAELQQLLSETLNKGWDEDEGKEKERSPVGMALLKRAISQVLLALELHPKNTFIRTLGNLFIDLVKNFQNEGMGEFFQQVQKKRDRINKTVNTTRKQVDVCKTCDVLQKPCKDCFFRWYLRRHEVCFFIVHLICIWIDTMNQLIEQEFLVSNTMLMSNYILHTGLF